MEWTRAFVGMASTLMIAMGSSIWGALFSRDRQPSGAPTLRQHGWFWGAMVMLLAGAFFGIVAAGALPLSS